MELKNHNATWSLEDLVLVANTLPTKSNKKLLSKSLGRTEKAIIAQWYLIYASKSYLKQPDGTLTEHCKNVIKARNIVDLSFAIGRVK